MGAWIEIWSTDRIRIIQMSLPSWERGLKFIMFAACIICVNVAPLVGAWIEIYEIAKQLEIYVSLPSWERGLKCHVPVWNTGNFLVAPLVGAWIEIYCRRESRLS